MWRVMVPALFVLAGCPTDPTKAIDSADTGATWMSVAGTSLEVTPEGELDGLSLAARGVDVLTPLEQLGVELSLSNLSTTSDCAVAVYASETAPDAGALYAIDPAEDPPAEVAGLGELVAADNLPRIWDAEPTEVQLAWWTDVTVSEDATVVRYVTLVTCVDPSLALQGTVQVSWSHAPATLSTLGDWSLDQAW